jgi:hypothetical protein
VYFLSASRAGELRSRVLGLGGAAVAVGLSAHLLSKPAWHRGSVADVLLLVLAAFCLRIGSPSVRGPANAVMVAAGAAAFAVIWPLLEPNRHDVSSEICMSLLWVLPVALTFICSLSIFASESFQVVRTIGAIIRFREQAHPPAQELPKDTAPFSVTEIIIAINSRRGPPASVLALLPST